MRRTLTRRLPWRRWWFLRWRLRVCCLRPTAGKIITRFGERPVYTIGMLIVSVTSFMIAFAWDYWALLAARAVAGIGSVMFTVSAMGLLVRLPSHMRGRISGYYATAFLLGNLLGPVIASALVPFGLRAPFIVYGFSLLVAGLIVWFLMPSQATLEAERDAIAEAARLAERKGTGTLPSEAPPPASDSAERSETEANSPPRLSLLPRHRLTPPTRPPTPRPPRVGATCRR